MSIVRAPILFNAKSGASKASVRLCFVGDLPGRVRKLVLQSLFHPRQRVVRGRTTYEEHG